MNKFEKLHPFLRKGVGIVYEGQLSTGGIWHRKGEGSHQLGGGFLRKPNPYLRKETEGSKNTLENFELFGAEQLFIGVSWK